MIPLWAPAGGWGLLAGGALLIGAALGYFVTISPPRVAAVMAFGSGVLISAVSFELMDEAFHQGGVRATALGALAGALVYTAANRYLATRGARHRKRSGDQQPGEDEGGSGLAIAVGSLLDGVPESIVIGTSLISGRVRLVTVAAIFLSNLPEGLSSAAGMRRARRSAGYVFGVWGGIALVSGLASLLGYTLFQGLSPVVTATTTAVAAGAILAMVADTMIPEAFEQAHSWVGLLTVVGFLVSFLLSRYRSG